MAEATPPISFRLEQGAEAAAPQLVEALDMIAETPGVVRLRAWAREALAPRPGERAVDVGSGTGDEVLALATLVGPSGEAIGVDPNAGLRAEAARRASAAGSAAVFVDGDAYALPFADDTVDLARSERVLQHLDDPARAIGEMARVLRPGGRLVVIDSDWATAIVHPAETEVVDALRRYWIDSHPNPFAGRRLAGQVTAAGLVVDDLGSQALIRGPGMITTLITMLGRAAAANGVITEAQLSRFGADLEAGSARGDLHISVTMFGVLAHKPGSGRRTS